ncbi:MAG: hypothetical protein ABGX00_12695 [Allomuricauda sp.]
MKQLIATLLFIVLLWISKYIVETTTKEEIPGTYIGEDYQFIWHCATYCLIR